MKTSKNSTHNQKKYNKLCDAVQTLNSAFTEDTFYQAQFLLEQGLSISKKHRGILDTLLDLAIKKQNLEMIHTLLIKYKTISLDFERTNKLLISIQHFKNQQKVIDLLLALKQSLPLTKYLASQFDHDYCMQLIVTATEIRQASTVTDWLLQANPNLITDKTLVNRIVYYLEEINTAYNCVYQKATKEFLNSRKIQIQEVIRCFIEAGYDINIKDEKAKTTRTLLETLGESGDAILQHNFFESKNILDIRMPMVLLPRRMS